MSVQTEERAIRAQLQPAHWTRCLVCREERVIRNSTKDFVGFSLHREGWRVFNNILHCPKCVAEKGAS